MKREVFYSLLVTSAFFAAIAAKTSVYGWSALSFLALVAAIAWAFLLSEDW